jgi:hypothetical protein
MDGISHRAGLPRLPVWAAVFVVLVCLVIVASTGWTEWASRDNELRNAEIELSNLVQSLRQHADDTAELAESILTGMVGGLETDNGDPAHRAASSHPECPQARSWPHSRFVCL